MLRGKSFILKSIAIRASKKRLLLNQKIRSRTTILSCPSLALVEKPGVRIQGISYPKTSHISIPVIDVDPIREKQILLHPSFQLAGSTSDIDSAAVKASLDLERRPRAEGCGFIHYGGSGTLTLVFDGGDV